MCRPLQTTAASFQADAPPPSTFTLNGVDYSAAGLAKLRAEAQQEAAALMGVKLPPREWHCTLPFGIGKAFHGEGGQQRITQRCNHLRLTLQLTLQLTLWLT